MVTNVFLLVVVILLSFGLGAEIPDPALDTGVKSSFKCPCKCYFGKQQEWAYKECYKPYYKHCKVDTCYKHGYKGKWCCDEYKPPVPKCDCKCVDYHLAVHQCKYKDHCEVRKCHGHYYYKYECCDKY